MTEGIGALKSPSSEDKRLRAKPDDNGGEEAGGRRLFEDDDAKFAAKPQERYATSQEVGQIGQAVLGQGLANAPLIFQPQESGPSGEVDLAISLATEIQRAMPAPAPFAVNDLVLRCINPVCPGVGRVHCSQCGCFIRLNPPPGAKFPCHCIQVKISQTTRPRSDSVYYVSSSNGWERYRGQLTVVGLPWLGNKDKKITRAEAAQLCVGPLLAQEPWLVIPTTVLLDEVEPYERTHIKTNQPHKTPVFAFRRGIRVQLQLHVESEHLRPYMVTDRGVLIGVIRAFFDQVRRGGMGVSVAVPAGSFVWNGRRLALGGGVLNPASCPMMGVYMPGADGEA